MDGLIEPLLALTASPWIFLAVFVLAMIDGFFPPVPSETIVVGAAAIGASTGSPELVLLGLAAAAGAFTGDNIAYTIGRAVGTERFRWMRSGRGRRGVEFARRGLERGGASAILVARYIPVGRVAVNLTAGAVGYARPRFLLLSLAAAVSWAAYSVAIGALAAHLVGDHPLVGAAASVVLAILVGVVVDRAIAWRRRSRDRQVPSKSAAAKSTGTQPTVVRNTASRVRTYPTP